MRGGARSGAGRKKKIDKYAKPVAAAEKQCADRLPEVVDAMIDLALGIPMVNKLSGEPVMAGGRKLYQVPPDRAAAEYLWNRIAGKPTEHIDAEVTDQRPRIKVLLGLDEERIWPTKKGKKRSAKGENKGSDG